MATAVACPACGVETGIPGCPSCGAELLPDGVAAISSEARAVALDQTLSDEDQTVADEDQTASDQDQTWSDHDQAASQRDQRSAEEDQDAADEELAAGGDATVHMPTIGIPDARTRFDRVAEALEAATSQSIITGLAKAAASDGLDELIAAAHADLLAQRS